MQKTKFLKKSIVMMVCAVMLVFGAIAVVNDTAEANVSILDINVTYELGDGPAEADVTLPAGESWAIGEHKLAAAPVCKNTDFVFMYWVDADGNRYDAESNYEVTMENAEPIVFKAVWGVSVTYDVNISDADETVTAPAPGIAAYKTDFSIKEQLTATNYNFIGWAKTATAVTADYKYGDVIKAEEVTGAIKLYAVWQPNFYQVIYHANTDSDEGDAAVTVPVDNTKYMGDNLTATVMGNGKLASTNKNYATMKDATPARTGYTFVGWATTATATTAEYKPGATIANLNKDVDLYAVWTKGTATTATNTTTTTKSTTSTTPQTGDSDHFALYIVMAALSLLGIGYLCYDQKKAKARK